MSLLMCEGDGGAPFSPNYLILIECLLVKGRTRPKDKLNENVLEAQGQCLEASSPAELVPQGGD